MSQTTNKNNKALTGAIAEIAFFAFLYYAQYLLKVEANLWISSLILLVLANIALAYCPVLGKKCE
jgi:hypothetical protein